LIGLDFLLFVSRDFEVGTFRPLRIVDRQSRTGLIYWSLMTMDELVELKQ